MTAEDAGDGYLAAMADVAAVHLTYRRRQQELAREHAERVRVAEASVERAAQATPVAAAGLRAARTLVNQVDEDAEGLWHSVLSQVPARRAARAEPLPKPILPVEVTGPHGEPDAGPTGAELTGSIAVLLSEAHELLAQVREGRRPSAGEYLVLALLGAVSAAAVYAAARGLVVLGKAQQSPLGVVLAVVGRILTFVSPLFGLVGIKWYLDRRGARFSVGVLGIVVGAGLLVVCGAGLLAPP